MDGTSKKVLNEFDLVFFSFVGSFFTRLQAYISVFFKGQYDSSTDGGARTKEVQTTVTKLVLTTEMCFNLLLLNFLQHNTDKS